MTITPRDIRTVTFGKPALGRRGYSEEDVDPFLEEVAAELQSKLDKLNDVTHQLEVARAALDSLPARPEPSTQPIPVASEPPRVDTSPQAMPAADVTEILALATETARRYQQEAQAKAAGVEEKAQQAALRILTEARNDAAELIEQAQTQGREALAAYEQRADAVQAMLDGLRDNLRPYFEQNLTDLDRLIPADDEASGGAHAKGERP